MKKLASSSEIYLIKAQELQALPQKVAPKFQPFAEGEITLLLDEKGGDSLISGYEQVVAAAGDAFLPVRLAYCTCAPWLAFFINLIKPVKRRFYAKFPSAYTTTLACLLQNNISRGERNAQNAYQWSNKKWQITPEEAHKRYSELSQSIKANGYDAKSPMLIMLNRKFGVKDQILQGHHRIGICKELGVKEVTVSFWAVPRSFSLLKFFIRKKKS